jgi:vacuolar-type H+-ATPase subunit E/Vma4
VVVDAAVTGVVIELERGVRVDATLDAIVERTWPDLAAEAIR